MEGLQIDDDGPSASGHSAEAQNSSSHLRKLELVQEFGQFEGAWDVAYNSTDKSLVVSDFRVHPNQVVVFGLDDGDSGLQYVKKFHFDVSSDEESTPLDVAISAENKYLIAKCDAGFDVFTADGVFEKTQSIICMGVKGATSSANDEGKNHITSCITTTKDDKIIAGSVIETDNIDATMPTSVVKILNPSGTAELQTIPVSLMPVRIATNAHGTRVVVSNVDDDKVCVYDAHSKTETLALEISNPLGVAYDDQTDCLLIGRMTQTNPDGDPLDGTGVIEQYCGVTGRLVGILAHGLYGPTGMTMMDGNKLAVADMKTVKLYQFK